eukprot:12429148-Karenia_brevis.AAC.1
MYGTPDVCFSGKEYGNTGCKVDGGQLSDLSKLPLRTPAEGFFQPMGDITNSCRSVPVSADPSVAGS